MIIYHAQHVGCIRNNDHILLSKFSVSSSKLKLLRFSYFGIISLIILTYESKTITISIMLVQF